MRFPSCFFCSHFIRDFKCKAYPDGIPEEILSGEHDHKNPYKGDNGIQFEPIEE